MRSVPKYIRIPRINFSYPGWFVVVFGLVCTSFLTAQNGLTIAGNIFDENNRPVPFATVIQTATLKGTMCDEKGFFTLNTLKKEKVVLEISSIGFEQKTVEIAPESNYVELTENLQSSAMMVSEVEVKGETDSEAIERSGFAVTSIDTRKLQSSSIDPNTVLDRVPGVRVRRNGGLGSRATYNINGLSGRAVTIFIDGVPASSLGSAFSLNSIPISLIERIDVYKGVVPIEFGVDAMGGVINVVTKNYNHNNVNFAYSGGSFNTHRADVNGAWRNKKTGFTTRISAFFNHADNDYDVWSENIKIIDYTKYLPDGSRNPDYLNVVEQGIRVPRFHDVYQSYGAKADIGISTKPWADELFASFTLSDAYRESQNGPSMITPYGERFYTDQTAAASIRYKKNNLFVKGLNINTNFQYSLTQRLLVDTTRNNYDWHGNLIPRIPGVITLQGEAGSANLNEDNNHTYTGFVNGSYSFSEQHMLSFNYTLNVFIRKSDDEMAERETRAFGTTNTLNKQISGLSYQSVFFDDDLRTSVFVKNYYNNIQQKKIEFANSQFDTIAYQRPSNDWGYGATVAYQLNDRIRINSSMERALRLVSANEVFGEIAEEVIESPELKPEKSLNINLGSEITLVNNGPHLVNMTSNLFYRDTYDRISRKTETRGDDEYSLSVNIGRVLSKGAELQLNYNYGPSWYVMVQGYYLDSRLMTKYNTDGEKNTNYKAREPNMPWLTGNATVTKKFMGIIGVNDMLTLTWYFTYIHKFIDDNGVIGKQNLPWIPTQIINDINVTYQFSNQRLSLSLDATNIFDQKAFDNYALQKPGRAFYGKITYRIF